MALTIDIWDGMKEQIAFMCLQEMKEAYTGSTFPFRACQIVTNAGCDTIHYEELVFVLDSSHYVLG